MTMTSPDGVTWTSRVAAVSNNWAAVTYAGSPLNTFVAVSDEGMAMGVPMGTSYTF